MDNYIEHHGILGQKWGVRRYQNKDGSLTAAGRKKLGINGKKFNAAKKKRQNAEKAKSEKEEKKTKSLSDYSDEEIQAMINRLTLEKRLKELTAPPKKEISRGQKFVNDLLDSSLKGLGGAAGDLSKDMGKYIVGSAINKAMGVDVINLKEKKKDKNKDD